MNKPSLSHFGPLFHFICVAFWSLDFYFLLVSLIQLNYFFFSCDLYLQLSTNGTRQFMKYRCTRAVNVPQIKNAPLAIVNVRIYFMCDADTQIAATAKA